jgi:uncharacterized membrane protein
MEEQFRGIAANVALAVEAGAVVIVAVGSAQALFTVITSLFAPSAAMSVRKQVWISYAMWLLLGLEFELAADIIRSVIAPTWQEIGQLAAIAAIRTFLNYFLSRDIESTTVEADKTAPAA